MRVLLTGPDPLMIQEVVNILGGRGHELHVASCAPGGLADQGLVNRGLDDRGLVNRGLDDRGLAKWPSRWVRANHAVAGPADDPAWSRAIREIVMANSIDVVLPLGDHLTAIAQLPPGLLGKAQPVTAAPEAIAMVERPSFMAGLGLRTADLGAPSATGIAQFLFDDGLPILVHASIVRAPWRPGYPAAATTLTRGHPDLIDAATSIAAAVPWRGPLTVTFQARLEDEITFSYGRVLAELGSVGNAGAASLDLASRWIALSRPDLLAFRPGTLDRIPGQRPRLAATAGAGAAGEKPAPAAKSHAFTLLAEGPSDARDPHQDAPGRGLLRIMSVLRLGVFRGSREVVTPWRTDLATRRFLKRR